MATQLSLDDHLAGLARSGAVLREAAARAGLHAKVPTCPGWDVTDLVAHQGMVHRWAAANLSGDTDDDGAAFEAEGKAAADPLAWFAEGLAVLLDTLRSAPDDVTAPVFLRDAPPPRRFWARRQCHETTIHGVDALSAVLQRWPAASQADIDPVLAADGIDELLTGFITRSKGRLRAAEPFTVLVRTTDTGHAWTVQVSDGPVVTTEVITTEVITTEGETSHSDAIFSGTAVQLYLSLWNRADEITAEGWPGALSQWRSQVRVTWS